MSKSYLDALRKLSEALKENERLRAALREIIDDIPWAEQIARRALAEITAATSDDHDQEAPVSAQAGG